VRPDVHVKTVKFESWLSICENLLGFDSVSDEIVSPLAQLAIKSFPRCLSQRMLHVENQYITKKAQLTHDFRI
jgi:hypothetical protein